MSRHASQLRPLLATLLLPLAAGLLAACGEGSAAPTDPAAAATASAAPSYAKGGGSAPSGLTARAAGRVSGGLLATPASTGVVSVTNPSIGLYCITLANFSGMAPLAVFGVIQNSDAVAMQVGSSNCPAGTHLRVGTKSGGSMSNAVTFDFVVF